MWRVNDVETAYVSEARAVFPFVMIRNECEETVSDPNAKVWTEYRRHYVWLFGPTIKLPIQSQVRRTITPSYNPVVGLEVVTYRVPFLDSAARFEEFKNLAQQTVEPDSWEFNGGNGTIKLLLASRAVVVRNRSSAQDKFASLINQLIQLDQTAKARGQSGLFDPAVSASPP